MTVLAPLHADASQALALALVESSVAPLVLLGENLRVIAASRSFCAQFQIEPATVAGRAVAELGGGEWDLPQLTTLLAATLAGSADIDAYELDLCRKGHSKRQLIVNARRLNDVAAGQVRLLLTIADVTQSRIAERLKDDLLRDKAMLMQELQHRVANSLQIIASVLLQSARRVQSDETRSHLHSAHQRVMSVAALQTQLSLSNHDDVTLRSYFGDLCTSLGASMIRDRARISLVVTTDESIAPADMSVSLGLIVTELVINALKHAFLADGSGTITVDYRAQDATGWTLSVCDDGAGMAASPPDARPGLGTSLVQALARQLDAEVVVSDAHPGTRVSVTHIAADAGGAPILAPMADAV